jgi:predicted peroxiredoxin
MNSGEIYINTYNTIYNLFFLPAVLFKSMDMLVSLFLNVKSVNVLVKTSPESILISKNISRLFWSLVLYLPSLAAPPALWKGPVLY